MKNLFEPTTAAQILLRLETLRPDSQARWGKMNVSQMLAHCQAPFHTYFGDLKLKRGLIGFMFGSMAKKKLFTEQPWKQGLPTAKEFVIVDQKDFHQEKSKLISLINRFSTGKEAPPSAVHPFFGKMTPEEWAMLAYKHLDHHLTQFGA